MHGILLRYCIIPLILLNSFVLDQFFGASVQVALGDSIFRGILFIAVCWLYKTMLYTHWQKYKQAFWRSSLLVVVWCSRFASGDFFHTQSVARW